MADYPPETFDPVFTAPQQPTIVGGHAVNLWASYYAQRDPRLAAFQPFLSKDGDIYASDKELARAIAAAGGWTFVDNPEFRSISLGNIEMKRGDEYLRVDVLRSVYGLSNDDLTHTAFDLHRWANLPSSVAAYFTKSEAGQFGRPFSRGSARRSPRSLHDNLHAAFAFRPGE